MSNPTFFVQECPTCGRRRNFGWNILAERWSASTAKAG